MKIDSKIAFERKQYFCSGWLKHRSLLILLSIIIVFIPSCVHSDLQQISNLVQVPDVDIGSVYRRLESAGFEPGPYSETDMRGLSMAIERFQRFAKLAPSGILDSKTWENMQILYDPVSAPSKSDISNSSTVPSAQGNADKLQSGKDGSYAPAWPPIIVRMTQEIIARIGYDPGRMDGVLDSKTAMAIEKYQRTKGISVGNSIDKKTLIALIKSYCSNGCEFRLLITPSDMSVLSSLWLSDSEPIGGTILEGFLIQALQIMLQQSGYETDELGEMGSKTRDALLEFKKSNRMESGKAVDAETTQLLFSSVCSNGCVFIVSTILDGFPMEQDALSTSEPEIQPIITHRDYNDYPIEIGDNAFAVEKSECSDISGDWIIFYEGAVTAKNDEFVRIRLGKRFGYRFHPDSEGLDEEDWWCIPRRKHCYSTIDFNDWGGKYMLGHVVEFFKGHVFNSRITIINGISQYLKANCNR